MSDLKRALDLVSLLAKKSFFLFGPRATGKSTLIRQQLADEAFVVDLLDSRNYLRLSAAPGWRKREFSSITSWSAKTR